MEQGQTEAKAELSILVNKIPNSREDRQRRDEAPAPTANARMPDRRAMFPPFSFPEPVTMNNNTCPQNSSGEIDRLQAEISQLHYLLRQALPVLVEAEYLGSAVLSAHKVRSIREQVDKVLDIHGLSAPEFVRESPRSARGNGIAPVTPATPPDVRSSSSGGWTRQP
jgi:hypothetical protein